MTPPLYTTFEGGANGTTLTPGYDGNTGTSGNYLDIVSVGTGGTVQFSTTHPAHGVNSCKIATGSTAAPSYIGWSAQLGTQTTHYGRLGLNLSAAPGASDSFILFQTGSGSFNGGIQVTTAAVLRVQLPSFATPHTFATTLAAGTQYRVEWELICSTTTGSIIINLYAGDSTTTTETYTGTSQNWGTNVTGVLVGWTGSHASQPAVEVDDWALSTTAFPGPATKVAVLGGAGALAATVAGAPTALLAADSGTLTPLGVIRSTAILPGNADTAAAGAVLGAATLPGAGSAAASSTALSSTEMDGAGTVTAAGGASGAATLAASTTILAIPNTEGAFIAATGAVTAAGTVTGTAEADGLSYITASGIIPGTAELDGIAGLGGSPVVVVTAVLTATGTVTGTALLGQTAELDGLTALTPSVTFGMTAELDGLGEVDATVAILGRGTLTGAGAVTATGTVPRHATLTAAGAVTAKPTIGAAVTLAGLGALFAGQGVFTTATLTATTALVPSAAIEPPGALAAAGAVTARAKNQINYDFSFM